MENTRVLKDSCVRGTLAGMLLGGLAALGVQALYPIATSGGENLLSWGFGHLYIAFVTPARAACALFGLNWPLMGHSRSLTSISVGVLTDAFLFGLAGCILAWLRYRRNRRRQQ